MLHIILFLSFTVSFLLAQPITFTKMLHPKTRSSPLDINKKIFVDINIEALKKNQSITINLPKNGTATFENSKFIIRSQGNFTWIGKSGNGSEDSLILTTKGGSTYGIISANKTKYILRVEKNGYYSVTLQPKRTVSHDDFIQLPPKKIYDSNTKKELKGVTPPQGLNQTIPKRLRSITNNRVDVLVLYTSAYADFYTNTLAAKIQASIDYANQAMDSSHSEIAMTYNLVKEQLFENADSNESVGINTALNRISVFNQNSDVRHLRASYHADLVTLFRLNTTGGYVGLGYMAGDNSKTSMRRTSYNVSEFDDITFAHESGHNLGCGHSRNVNGGCGGALFNYACGFDDGTTGTIMSYNNSNIQYFSSPDKTYNGTIIGAADTDCARAIRETKDSMTNVSDITEVNEAVDSITENTISGTIDPIADRDYYEIGLGGITTFALASDEYSNAVFFLNLYDKDGFLIASYDDDTQSINLDNNIYKLVIADQNDITGSSYNATVHYHVNITTSYTPPVVNNANLTPIINYLLN